MPGVFRTEWRPPPAPAPTRILTTLTLPAAPTGPAMPRVQVSGALVRALAVKVRVSGAWVDATAIKVRSGGAWVDAI